MSKFTITIATDSVTEASDLFAFLKNGASPRQVSQNAPQSAPAPAHTRAPVQAPAPARAPVRAPAQAPAPAPQPVTQRAPRRNPQQLADAIVGCLADGSIKSANEIARAIVTAPPSVVGPLAQLTSEGHLILSNGRYQLAQAAEETGTEYASDEGGEIEYPEGDDD